MPATSWSTNPANNNSAAPNGAPEGMTPGSVNDVIRQVMADAAVEFQKNQIKVLGSVAGTNTITGALTPALTAYSAGMIVVFTPANNNTGAATLNVNSLGALDIQKADGDALVSGDLVAGVPALLVLDSGADDWILINAQDIARIAHANTFTQSNTFSLALSGNAAPIVASSNVPALILDQSNAAANNRYWSFAVASEQLLGQLRNDAGSSATAWLTIDRTANTVDTINLQATAVQINGQSVSSPVTSGTYTPTVTGVSNIDSTSSPSANYLRIGNIVQVSGFMNVDCTAATVSQLRITLPITSNFSGGTQANGFGIHSAALVQISSDSVNDAADFIWTADTTSSTFMRFMFQYQVI